MTNKRAPLWGPAAGAVALLIPTTALAHGAENAIATVLFVGAVAGLVGGLFSALLDWRAFPAYLGLIAVTAVGVAATASDSIGGFFLAILVVGAFALVPFTACFCAGRWGAAITKRLFLRYKSRHAS